MLTIASILLLCSTVVSEGNNSRPEWSVTHAEDFAYDRYVSSIDRISRQLSAFRALTTLIVENSEPKLQMASPTGPIAEGQRFTVTVTGADLKSIGHSLDWAAQAIGATNSITLAKGYGLVTQRRLLELELKNALLTHQPARHIDSLRTRFETASADLEGFLQESSWID